MDIKLERAIEIMEPFAADTFEGPEEEWVAAVKLSYEALKFTQGWRESLPRSLYSLLPGETEK